MPPSQACDHTVYLQFLENLQKLVFTSAHWQCALTSPKRESSNVAVRPVRHHWLWGALATGKYRHPYSPTLKLWPVTVWILLFCTLETKFACKDTRLLMLKTSRQPQHRISTTSLPAYFRQYYEEWQHRLNRSIQSQGLTLKVIDAYRYCFWIKLFSLNCCNYFRDAPSYNCLYLTSYSAPLRVYRIWHSRGRCTLGLACFFFLRKPSVSSWCWRGCLFNVAICHQYISKRDINASA